MTRGQLINFALDRATFDVRFAANGCGVHTHLRAFAFMITLMMSLPSRRIHVIPDGVGKV